MGVLREGKGKGVRYARFCPKKKKDSVEDQGWDVRELRRVLREGCHDARFSIDCGDYLVFGRVPMGAHKLFGTSARSRNYATLASRHLLEESEEIGMDDAHSAIGISLIHHAGDVDFARSWSWLACSRYNSDV